MGNIFAASEIVQMGIEIEKNGRDFYNTLIKKSKNPTAQEMFRVLSGEEEKHILAFKGILSDITKYEPPESYTGEHQAYMKSLSEEHVFTKQNKGKQIAESVKEDKQAVELGIGFEKDSIVFYDGIKKSVPESEHKIIDNLIAQEQEHLKKLTDLQKTL